MEATVSGMLAFLHIVLVGQRVSRKNFVVPTEPGVKLVRALLRSVALRFGQAGHRLSFTHNIEFPSELLRTINPPARR